MKSNMAKSDYWSECLLLENQLGFKSSQSDKLFANHGYTPEMGYKQSKRCQHRHHQPESGKKPLLQGLFQYIDVYPLEKIMLFPTGSVIYFNHTKNENKIDKDEPPDIHITQDNSDYETREPVISENILNISHAEVADLSETLDVSPIKFQIKIEKVADLSEGRNIIFKKSIIKHKRS